MKREKSQGRVSQQQFESRLQFELHDLCCLWNNGFVITKSKKRLQKQLRTHFEKIHLNFLLHGQIKQGIW